MNETGTATYCPEDNKLRLYVGRVPRDEYEKLRAMGWKSTPKQDCDFVATWSPEREDAALGYLDDGDDIGDEDQSPEDRAADRAERFAGYREKRRSEAHGFADAYDDGPDAYGSQNAARAERQAAKRDRIGSRACSQWSKAEYWQTRTVGVISHALHKSSAPVRRGRVLRLEAEQRKHESACTPDPDQKPIMQDGRDGKRELHYWVHNGSRGGWWCAASTIEAAKTDPIRKRWSDHYNLRLSYERQMLEAEGGTAGNVEMQPGGTFGGYLIVKVNKSNTTGAVVSVNVHSPSTGKYDYRQRGDTQLINIQRFGESAYKPPTPESLAQLAEITGKAKAKAKTRNAGKPKLINPTSEDAERLQAELNRIAYAKIQSAYKHTCGEPKPTPVLYMTQKQYSTRSKGTYSRFETQNLHAGAVLDDGQYWRSPNGPIVCKIRTGPRGQYTIKDYGTMRSVWHTDAASIVVITDKPQKPLPDWSKVEQPETEAVKA